MVRGSEVLVKVHRNKRVTRIVWEMLPHGVAVTDAVEFGKMMRGEPAIWPVVLPMEDVSISTDYQQYKEDTH